MRNRILPSIFLIAFLFSNATKADEGMWLPLLLSKNEAEMQKMGLKLTAKDIYDINKGSLKDAIVMLNGGSCTGEMISSEGLILTNHHCGYGLIQSHSSEAHNYLDEGFWAMDRAEELPNKDYSVSFLQRIEDVSERVNKNLNEEMNAQERATAIQKAFKEIIDEATKETHYNATVKSFFKGNEFYLMVYETFKDVRVVGAPPSSIGKYGGDTDNWMWPRHTGDFCMLRVYTGPNGEPAEYSDKNIPYQPKHHLPVSLDGVKPGDFSMTMGYPGSTDRYLSSAGVNEELKFHQPTVVEIREVKLNLLKQDMDASENVRIKYASKYAGSSNYYKYFKGQMRGLKRLKVYDKKLALENEFQRWVHADGSRIEKYGTAVETLNKAYEQNNAITHAFTYLLEAGWMGGDLFNFCYNMITLEAALNGDDENAKQQAIDRLMKKGKAHFKDYNAPTDEKVTAALSELMIQNLAPEYHPEFTKTIAKKYKGDTKAYFKTVFAKSVFTDEARFNAFMANPSAKVIAKDPAVKATKTLLASYQQVYALKAPIQTELNKGYRLFVAGLREMNPTKNYAPDANSTMRLSYGKVMDYYPADAVHFDYYTTLAGVMEKEDPTNPEFVVPSKLRDLYERKDYGQYGVDGVLNVCFISNNDITGGNSGSPVINGKGELIGLAFDGNWEAMSGDIAFEPELQRTISVDIRYVLFLIDKFAGATHLVNEMTLVGGKNSEDEFVKKDKSKEESEVIKN